MRVHTAYYKPIAYILSTELLIEDSFMYKLFVRVLNTKCVQIEYGWFMGSKQISLKLVSASVAFLGSS
jgi:hypothetical protein